MTETIQEIKRKLKDATSLDDLKPFLADERKGVQEAIKAAERMLTKQAKLAEQLLKMKQYEEIYYQKGYQLIAGVDEVGRGPLAGPVVSAAVILPQNSAILGINDSKQLSESKRETLFSQIQEQSIAIGIGIVEHDIIDDVNIYEATKIAMRQALDALFPRPDFTLIDAMPLHYSEAELSLIKGDSKSISIAAASIIAKVTRDRLMKKYEIMYPGYGFGQNMGYGTKTHLDGLKRLGACPIHRLSFAPVKEI